MASTDWAECVGVLDAATVDRGVTAGIARPNGGGSFIYGFNSLTNTPGAVALYTAQVAFAPMAKGGRISGALQRGVSGGNLNYSGFLFIGLGGTNVSDNAYLLGLSDDDPHRIVLRKGRLLDGLPTGNVGSSGILARSTATFSPGVWKHLLLDMIVNANGDVVLKCGQNDLGLNTVSAPTFAPIPGISDFIDDALGVNSGSAPYTSGYAGFGMTSKDITRRVYVDHVAIARQL